MKENRHWGRMGIILLVVCLLLAGCSVQKQQAENQAGNAQDNSSSTFRIVTSFYPIYVDVLNITKGVEGVTVVNMTKPQTGCLHDYQLTTEDLKTLSNADAFVVNGAGMESFLDKAAQQNPKLKIIDASKDTDMTLLKDGDETNSHVWLSVTYNIAQVKSITAQLAAIDPAHADAYRKNALDYVTKLDALRADMHKGLDDLPHKDIVTFHEAFPYLAKEFKLHVAAVIESEPGQEPSPKELESVIQKVNALPVKALFVEPQYPPTAADTIARETGAKIYGLDPVVTPQKDVPDADAYINAMRKNTATLKEALQ